MRKQTNQQPKKLSLSFLFVRTSNTAEATALNLLQYTHTHKIHTFSVSCTSASRTAHCPSIVSTSPIEGGCPFLAPPLPLPVLPSPPPPPLPLPHLRLRPPCSQAAHNRHNSHHTTVHRLFTTTFDSPFIIWTISSTHAGKVAIPRSQTNSTAMAINKSFAPVTIVDSPVVRREKSIYCASRCIYRSWVEKKNARGDIRTNVLQL